MTDTDEIDEPGCVLTCEEFVRGFVNGVLAPDDGSAEWLVCGIRTGLNAFFDMPPASFEDLSVLWSPK